MAYNYHYFCLSLIRTTDTNTTTTTHYDLRPTQTDHAALRRLINTHKLRRFVLTPAELTPAAERARADAYLAAYVRALSLGADLPATELQPADDLVLLAAQAFVGIWRAEGEQRAARGCGFYSCVCVRE